MKYLVSLLLFMITTTFAQENIGIAFVHGTSDHRGDDPLSTSISAQREVGNYWTREFIDSVRSVLKEPDNYTVIRCDFSATMIKGSRCLADQLAAFIDAKKITRYVVITHSHGGNMMRWVLSHPTNHNFAKVVTPITNVVSLAPSSLGTPLADLVIDGNPIIRKIAELVGFQSDAVRDQRKQSMANSNATELYGTKLRPNLPRPMWTITGSGASFFQQCGTVAYNSALRTLNALFLSACADGFLNCRSQEGAGKLLKRDIDLTQGGYYLNHEQSRRDCYGLDNYLRQIIPSLL